MVQYVKEKTNPGTTRETKNYEIIFVAGHQQSGCYLVEYEFNWVQLMKLILASLEMSENTFKDISLFLNRELEKYLSPGINVRLDIFDQTYFPKKQTKSLHLSFTDPSKTSLVFLIRRKQVLRRLKDISIQKVSEQMIQTSDLVCLEIPMSLKSEVIDEARTIWNRTNPQEDFQKQENQRNFGWKIEWRAEHLLTTE